MYKNIKDDLNAFLQRDPAAPSAWQVALLWPGFHAICLYRLSHWFWNKKWRFIARFISGFGRFLTSMEIHPGAKIGKAFVIDHGIGVIIGETSVIGNDVTMYHNVTLGGTNPSKNAAAQKGIKRHPTIEDGVTIGAGAIILGDITIGAYANIGAGSLVIKSVEPYQTIASTPARILKKRDGQQKFCSYGLSDGAGEDMPMKEITMLKQRIDELEQQIQQHINNKDM